MLFSKFNQLCRVISALTTEDMYKIVPLGGDASIKSTIGSSALADVKFIWINSNTGEEITDLNRVNKCLPKGAKGTYYQIFTFHKICFAKSIFKMHTILTLRVSDNIGYVYSIKTFYKLNSRKL